MTRLGVYVQVPFCQTKCTYCNFHTGVFSAELYAPYVKAVCREIAEFPRLLQENGIADVPEAVVDTVYFGGGTPSLLEPASLSANHRRDSRFVSVAIRGSDARSRPGNHLLRKSGRVARSRIQPHQHGRPILRRRGIARRGPDASPRRCFPAQRKFCAPPGFGNLSFDLIAGLPHQTDRSWEDSVEQLLHLRPEHVSIYMMEIDEGSRLGLEVLQSGERYSAKALPSDDAMANFYEHGCRRTCRRGLRALRDFELGACRVSNRATT